MESAVRLTCAKTPFLPFPPHHQTKHHLFGSMSISRRNPKPGTRLVVKVEDKMLDRSRGPPERDDEEEEEEEIDLSSLSSEEEDEMVEELECLEEAAIAGEDKGREPTDYDRRARIFFQSSKVFQAMKQRGESIHHSTSTSKD